MVNLKINIDGVNEEFKIPESWSEVSVKQTVDISSIDRDNLNDLEIIVELLSILGNIDKDIIYMMNQDDLPKLVEVLEFTNDEIKGELKEYIELEGEKYYLKKDFESLTLGEVASIETIHKKYDNIQLALPELLCIFLRKKNEDGKLESFKNDFMERKELFGNATITDVNDIFLFFLNGSPS